MTVQRISGRLIFALLALAAAFSVMACSFSASDSSSGSSTGSLSIAASTTPVSKIAFGSNSSMSITINGLDSQSVYIVKENNGSTVVSSASSGSIASSNLSGSSAAALSASSSTVSTLSGAVSGAFNTSKGLVLRRDFKPATNFSANPPSSSSSLSASRSARSASSTTTTTATATAETASVGDSKTVWVSTSSSDTATKVYDSDLGSYMKQITVYLRGTSTYASVWVASDYDANITSGTYAITTAAAQAIADQFKKIYPAETAVFGYEYGGGSSGSGGMDGKIPVDIILYDIDDDSSSVLTNGGTVGYFWAKDWYPMSTYEHSNVGELFYIDTVFAYEYPGVMYSTLVHEFQHMIDWNVKYVQNNKSPSTWYNEMMSQVAEDMFSTQLETWLGSSYSVDDDGPTASRMPYFDAYYYLSGATDWLSGYIPSTTTSAVYVSYATSYAMGAYLARNYGGMAFIKELASNSSVDGASVTAALASLGCTETTFAAAFARFPEALMCSTSGTSTANLASLNSFSKSNSQTLTVDSATYTYAFPSFDPWNISYSYTSGGSTVTETMSPTVASLSSSVELRPYGWLIQSDSSWLKATGTLTLTLDKPSNTNVTMYVIIRNN